MGLNFFLEYVPFPTVAGGYAPEVKLELAWEAGEPAKVS